jgi:hypothetical protein
VNCYQAYGAVLESGLELPELAPRARANPDLTVGLDGGRPLEGEWRWTDAPAAEPGRPWLAVASGPSGYRLNFEGGGDFVVSSDARRITVFPASASLDTVRHLLIDQVVPLVLAHLGHFVLHASAFMTQRGAVAFTGPAGSGKSTLSASFGAHGSPLLADDALVIEPGGVAWLARPAYPGLRVWPDVMAAVHDGEPQPVAPYTDKRRIGARDGMPFAAAPTTLNRIYVLGYEEVEEITIRPLSRRDALMALIAHSLTMDTTDTGRAVAQLDRAYALCRNIPVRRLTYPRELAALGDVRAAVLGDHSA